MIASENDQSVGQEPAAPQAAPATMAGFSTAATSHKTGSRDADEDTVDHLARIKAGLDNPQEPKSKLAKDFDSTEFMRLLCMIYGVAEIPTAVIPLLKDFELDSGKEKPATSDGTLYAVVDGATLEITRDSILTDALLTPELAYKMAAAASVNPAYKTLSLSGSMEDRVTLFLAAQHFGLEIEETSIPEVPEDQIAKLAAKFHEFEVSAQLEKNIAGAYLSAAPEAPAQTETVEAPRKQPKEQPGVRREPTFNPAFA